VTAGFQKNKGEILRIYVDSLGIDSNNVANLQSLVAGLLIATREGYKKIVAEGDPLVITLILKRLQ
jgi:hypothetical protein